ncbi:MAG: iron-containing redox enzyme family protein [Acidimicrobiales bacterium]
MRTTLPEPRGPVSERFVAGACHGVWVAPELDGIDPLVDDDLHLALWCAYQLHHGGFHGVAEDLEWDPSAIGFRRLLEVAFEGALRAEHRPEQLPADPATALRVIEEWSSPPLSRWLGSHGHLAHVRDFAIHRSAYQLKEADGHTWGLPRLAGRTKSTVVEIQMDEYGLGRPGQAHAELFAAAMEELGLDPAFGRYVGLLPGTTLATDNLLCLFGLNGRLRGALVGHLAHFEMSSPAAMRRYREAARRLGLPALARFYDVHAEIDVHHGRIALDHAVRPLAEEEPALAADITFGAAALHHVEVRFARHLLDCWRRREPTLLADPTTTAPTAVAPALGPAP